MCIYILLVVILAIAAIMDMYFDKIYNEWICFAIVTGLSCSVWRGGINGLLWALVAMTIPVLLLYPLFMINSLGAGDIKLLAAVGCFLSVKETMICVGISFFIAAVFSFLKMVAERNFLQRMNYLFSYVRNVIRNGEWMLYEKDEKEDRGNRKKTKIHFALPVLLGVAFYKGGIF